MITKRLMQLNAVFAVPIILMAIARRWPGSLPAWVEFALHHMSKPLAAVGLVSYATLIIWAAYYHVKRENKKLGL